MSRVLAEARSRTRHKRILYQVAQRDQAGQGPAQLGHWHGPTSKPSAKARVTCWSSENASGFNVSTMVIGANSWPLSKVLSVTVRTFQLCAQCGMVAPDRRLARTISGIVFTGMLSTQCQPCVNLEVLPQNKPHRKPKARSANQTPAIVSIADEASGMRRRG
jgi:hypothetical protein